MKNPVMRSKEETTITLPPIMVMKTHILGRELLRLEISYQITPIKVKTNPITAIIRDQSIDGFIIF